MPLSDHERKIIRDYLYCHSATKDIMGAHMSHVRPDQAHKKMREVSEYMDRLRYATEDVE